MSAALPNSHSRRTVTTVAVRIGANRNLAALDDAGLTWDYFSS